MSNKLKKIYNYYVRKNYDCICFKENFVNLQQSYVNSTETTNRRISHILSTNGQGGRIQFGLLGKALTLNSLGKIEGQIGGISKVLRNKF